MERPSLPLLFRFLDELPVGVVLLDVQGRVVHYNRYEERLARRERKDVIGRDFFEEIAPCLNIRTLAGEFREKIGRAPLSVDLETAFPFDFLPEPREVSLRLTSFDADGAPYAAVIVEDITPRKTVERMKETLSNLLVHDMKNPLAGALIHLFLLKSAEGVKADPEAIAQVEGAIRATQRLQRMIGNLLDVARLETDAMPVRRRSTDVVELAREALAEIAPLANARSVAVAFEGPTAAREEIDDELVRRIFDNLLENAVRHAKSRVVLRVSRGDGSLIAEVEDDGAGIPEDRRDEIFEKYAQLGEHDRMRSRMNRGLGLSFVRLATRAHQGRVEVLRGSDGGSIFRIWLPSSGPRP